MCEALLTLHAIADEACAGLGVALDKSDGKGCVYRARGRELLARTGSLARQARDADSPGPAIDAGSSSHPAREERDDGVVRARVTGGTIIRTTLTERYGIELPFVSAGMGFIAIARLAAAVSNAGGLGKLATGAAPPEVLRALIGETSALTARPVAVNFIIETTAFGPLATSAHLRVCIEERVSAVVFHWAPPPLEWVRMLKAGGCDVWLQTSSIATAQAAVASGVDIIIAQGREAGGHNKSTAGLFTLLPRMVDAVNPAPVIAAGGIADGRGMAAALCLGAAGVCVGTRLVASVESNAHDEYKRRYRAGDRGGYCEDLHLRSRVARCADARDPQSGRT